MSNEEMLHNAELTVDEALAAHAADLKVSIDWARTRLDRAAALVALAMEPDRPSGRKAAAWQIAQTLHLVELLMEEIPNGLDDEDSTSCHSVTYLAQEALRRAVEAATEAEGGRWDDDHVRRMTVAELAAALNEEPAPAKA